jgi:hypothetical protein
MLLCYDEPQGVHDMPRPDRVFVESGVYHVYNRIGRGEVLGVEGYGLKVRELAATLKKTPDGMSHALARGVRRRADDERFRIDLGKLDRLIATEGTKT